MKRQITSPLIAFSICLMLLPLSSLATVAGDGMDAPQIMSSGGWGSGENFDEVQTGIGWPTLDHVQGERFVRGGRVLTYNIAKHLERFI